MGDVFYAVAVVRDKGADPVLVIQAMQESDLPVDVKKEAPNIVAMVYSVPELTPDEIGFAIFGQCMEAITGVRRQA